MALAAAALIVAQLVIRAVLAFGGYFYWDDLILVGKAGTEGLLSPSYLFDDHDGHVMPAAFLVAGAIIRLAPLDWTWPAVSLLVAVGIAILVSGTSGSGFTDINAGSSKQQAHDLIQYVRDHRK